MSSTFQTNSFLEQCHFLCLEYLKNISTQDSDFDKEDSIHINKIVEKERNELNVDLQDVTSASQYFTDLSLEFEISSIGKVADSVKLIWHGDLSEDNFNAAADSLVDDELISNWNEVALLLNLMYRTLRVRSLSELNLVVQLTSNYLCNSAEVFIASQNGWKYSRNVPSEDIGDGDASHTNPEEILSSIVMIQSQETTDEADVLSCDTPPFSLLPPSGDDEESLNSATPPEIVDRPPMTSSLMQMMGGGDASNTAASSESAEFELISSVNSAAPSSLNSPKAMSDVAVEGGSEEIDTKQTSLPSPSPVVTPVLPPTVTPVPLPQSDKKKTQEAGDSPAEGVNVSDYLPQISIGVAAAAACIGFLVLKKATA